MSVRSQENNMRRLAKLLANDLGYIWGDRESGPHGDKKVFLNTGRTFLRAVAGDLGLRDAMVTANSAGIAISGDVTLMGMWNEGGICVKLSQPACGGDHVLCFRSIRHMRDHRGGYNHWISRRDLESMSYERLLAALSALRREVRDYERAA